jgi:protoporphyrinogen oxidase
LFSSSLRDSESPQRVAIIGGGLAGLSTAFQLLQKSPKINVTIFDKATVGTSGASSVAGG